MTFLELSPYFVAGAILAVAAWLIVRGMRRFFRGESGCSGCSSQTACATGNDKVSMPSCSSCSGCPSASRCASVQNSRTSGNKKMSEKSP